MFAAKHDFLVALPGDAGRTGKFSYESITLAEKTFSKDH